MSNSDGQHGLWLYVKPGVGLPLLLGGVAITALLVHAAILTHTSWFGKFLNGEKVKVSISHVLPGNNA